ncbi:serine hydrolase [Legionella sp. CNM-4043-24]|uniref:serine hydrolase n=1 Tax=Legionella sp. CNM-4043-24 TaxID=3421646 RepID=UPI00403AD27F
MKKSATLIFLFACLISNIAWTVSNKTVDILAHEFMQENQVEGMSIAVIDKGRTRIFNYGFADAPGKTPVTNDTIYTIASFTKTYTATLAAVASVENKLNLDEPFIRHFPDLNNDRNLGSITISQLLGHVSSFPFDFEPRPQNYTELVASLNQYDRKIEPGSEYAYSNAGIGTVGYVLQNVYSKNYQDILRDRILRPLNMNSTYLNVPAEKEKLIALGHDSSNNPVPYNSKNTGAWFAAASLKSTISDMAKYMNAHINHETLQDKTLARAIPIVHQNKYCFADKLACEQLAWQAHVISQLSNSIGDTYFIDYDAQGFPRFDKKKIVENKDFDKNRQFIDKTGSGYGMSGYMAYIPAEKAGVVILLNKDVGNERIRLGRAILSSRQGR